MASCSGDASDRTFQAAQDCPAGSVLASVPWALALSTESALERLQGLEKVGAGIDYTHLYRRYVVLKFLSVFSKCQYACMHAVQDCCHRG